MSSLKDGPWRRYCVRRSGFKCAANPESGTTSDTYRKGGQLATRTDARGVTLTVTYDGAQRVQTKSYSDGVTPTVRYCYDGEGYSGETCTVPEGRGSAGADYPRGHLTGYGSSVGCTNYTRIDGLGRVTKQEQTINGLVGTKTVEYAYGSGGALKEMTYPSGRKVTYSLTNVGRVSGVSGVYLLQPASYMATAKYGPMGMPLSWILNDDKVTEERLYNGLGQLTQVEAKTAAGSRWLRLQFAYPAAANDGNLKGQTIDTPTRTFQQHYGYDGASRLRMAIEKSSLTADLSAATCTSIQSTWPIGEACLRYQFDVFGNPWSAEQNRWTGLAANGPAWYLLPSGVVNNQIKDVGFDAAGNQWHVEVNDTQRVARYDGEGRVYLVKDNGITTAQYVHDGEGRRVKRKVGSAETYYAYGADGAMVAEYPPSMISPGPEYVVSDHLGSVRMKFNGAATVTMRRDYEPYGGEIARTGEGYGAADAVAMRFTAKERDAETGLDYFEARYLSSAQGRFSSPDPYNIITEAEDQKHFDAYISQPQKWNRYSYVWNNPLRYIDPHGETVHVVAYTTGNPDGGDDDFKKAALTLANKIMSAKGFDPKKDLVLVQGVTIKDDFKALLNEANSLESRFGKVGGLALFSHGGPDHGPRFGQNTAAAQATGQRDRQFYGVDDELSRLKINWESGATASFLGCNTAVIFCQRFANTQGVPSYGFDISSSFSGDPNKKTKMYLFQPWNPDLYLVGRDGRAMVRRDPQRPRR